MHLQADGASIVGLPRGQGEDGVACYSRRAVVGCDGKRIGDRHALDLFLDDWDLWVTPVAATPAFTHRPTGADLEIEGVSVPYALPIAPYNCPTAVTGHPILTLPAGQSDDGRPIGLQVHARRGTDATLLAAGRRLEDALGRSPSLAPLGA